MTSRWLMLVLALSLLQSGHATSDAPQALRCDPVLRPYRAAYDVYRNGKLAGLMISELRLDADGRWLYQVSTKATKGLGRFFGGQIQESSRFVVVQGELQAEHYDLSQRIAFSNLKRSADFDWDAKRASGKNKRKQWQLPLSGDETDRLSANIRIRQRLAAGNRQLSFRTIEKGEFKVRDFEARDAETVATGIGEMLAIPVHRKHSSPKRTTVSWHAPQLGFLPVRVEHSKKGDDSGKMILRDFQQHACAATAAGPVAD